MNPYKKLIRNSLIFAVGTLGSKVIQFMLVPLYTYYLSSGEYGLIDIGSVTVNMVVPFVTFSITEAVLRFIMGKEDDAGVVVTNASMIIAIGSVFAMLFYPLFSHYKIFGNSLPYLYAFLYSQILEITLAQYTRGIGAIKIFTINGIILTISTSILNLLFLVVFNMGIEGYFLALIFANLISCGFLILKTKTYQQIRVKYIDLKLSRRMLKYSIPLIPNSLMWWLTNASSRYFINFFVGLSANGVFAVASKIPALITIVNQIFQQAWQLSAIEEYYKKEKTSYFLNVFNYLAFAMFMGTSIIILWLKFLFQNVFSLEYYNAWKIVPFLLLSSVFSCFSSFLGSNYIAAKDTKGVFKTSVYGGISSIVLNLFFIPTLGVVGAGISSMLSFFLIFIIRAIDTQKYTSMSLNWSIFCKEVTLVLIQIIVLFREYSLIHEMVINLFCMLLLIKLNWNLIVPIERKIKRRIMLRK